MKIIKYNFYGITAIFDKNDPDYGVYEFKKGFNGQVEEYIDNFEIQNYESPDLLRKVVVEKQKQE